MGIYDNWNEFLEMCDEMRGTGATDLPPKGTWWDSFECWLEFGWRFLEFGVCVSLWIINFYLWLDVILYLERVL